MNLNDFLVIYSDVIVSEGAVKMTMIDPSRDKVFELPKSFFQLIYDLKRNSILKTQLMYEENFDSFIKFILENDLGMITSNPQQFPEIEMSFSSPEYINNAILDFYPTTNYKAYSERLKKLDNLGCKFYEFRMYLPLKLNILESILENIQFNSIKSININGIHSLLSDARDYIGILKRYPVVKNIFIFNSDSNFRINDEEIMEDQRLYFLTDQLENKNCGKISFSNLFIRSTEQIVENITHNSCLHKKIAIDKDGNIKNCPAMPESFGNIKDITLEKAINHKDFKKYWNLTKDEIEVCNDCEFRYICTDCRAYTERTHKNKKGLDISKPLKCGYNPYKGEWEEWSTNPLKQKAIKYYRIQDLVKHK